MIQDVINDIFFHCGGHFVYFRWPVTLHAICIDFSFCPSTYLPWAWSLFCPSLCVMFVFSPGSHPSIIFDLCLNIHEWHFLSALFVALRSVSACPVNLHLFYLSTVDALAFTVYIRSSRSYIFNLGPVFRISHSVPIHFSLYLSSHIFSCN